MDNSPNAVSSIFRKLLNNLMSDNSSERISAAETLGRFKSKSAVELLISLLDDNEPSVRLSAIKALGEIGDIRALMPLYKEWDDPGHLTYQDAVRSAIAKIINMSFGTIEACLQDGDTQERRAIAHMLSISQLHARVRVPLLNALGDSDGKVRQNAAWSLSFFNNDIEPALIERLDSSSDEIRISSALALAYRHDSRALMTLLAGLKNNKSEIRCMAALALGWLNNNEALNFLINAIHDDECEVRIAAIRSISYYTDDRIIDTLLDVITHDNCERAVSEAVIAIGQSGNSNAYSLLHQYSQDKNDAIRLAAISGFEMLEDPRAIADLKSALNDINPAIRAEAKYVLDDVRHWQ